MILVWFVGLGLAAGLIRAALLKRRPIAPQLNNQWIIFLACIPQILVFQIPATTHWFSDNLASIILLSSQLLLLTFCWLNRHLFGILPLSLGLLLNFIVIATNGGFMPVRPDAVHWLTADIPNFTWHIGSRLGQSKDIVLPLSDTNFWLLSDYFLLPSWLSQKVVFSFGDVLIGIGAFSITWMVSADVEESHHARRLGGSFA